MQQTYCFFSFLPTSRCFARQSAISVNLQILKHSIVIILGSSRRSLTLAEGIPLPRNLSQQHRAHCECSKHIASSASCQHRDHCTNSEEFSSTRWFCQNLTNSSSSGLIFCVELSSASKYSALKLSSTSCRQLRNFAVSC